MLTHSGVVAAALALRSPWVAGSRILSGTLFRGWGCGRAYCSGHALADPSPWHSRVQALEQQQFSAVLRAEGLAHSMAASTIHASGAAPLSAIEPPSILASEAQAASTGGYSTGVSTLPSGHGFKKTFYKRKLPCPPSVEFASDAGKSAHHTHVVACRASMHCSLGLHLAARCVRTCTHALCPQAG